MHHMPEVTPSVCWYADDARIGGLEEWFLE